APALTGPDRGPPRGHSRALRLPDGQAARRMPLSPRAPAHGHPADPDRVRLLRGALRAVGAGWSTPAGPRASSGDRWPTAIAATGPAGPPTGAGGEGGGAPGVSRAR